MRISPTGEQKKILSQWMGADRVIWNAKCAQWKYESTYARKYLPIQTYAEVNASYAQFKNKELTPYLFDVPAEVLKDAANRWRNTMHHWMSPEHIQKGPAKRKKKDRGGSVFLEKRLFHFEQDPETKQRKLFIGTKKNPVGYLTFNQHGSFTIPKSLRIRKKAGLWWLSFCYENGAKEGLMSPQERITDFKTQTRAELEENVIGIDRGIKVACHTNEVAYDFAERDKLKQKRRALYIKRHQRRMARQEKGSNRREKTKIKIARIYEKSANVRNEFCHQTSHTLTKGGGKVIVMENLKTAQMTKRPKAKKNPETGKWEKNGACRKKGLNRAILSIGWHKLETYTRYKAHHRGSLFVKIAPHFSSQECAPCGHIHPENRVSQAEFVCQTCGHRDHADRNAACVLKKRAIILLLHSGSELSDKAILHLPDSGRGVHRKTSEVRARSRNWEASKKTGEFSPGSPSLQ